MVEQWSPKPSMWVRLLHSLPYFVGSKDSLITVLLRLSLVLTRKEKDIMAYTWGEIQIESLKKMFLNNTSIFQSELAQMREDNKYKI